jgi:hypothetical protein
MESVFERDVFVVVVASSVVEGSVEIAHVGMRVTVTVGNFIEQCSGLVAV